VSAPDAPPVCRRAPATPPEVLLGAHVSTAGGTAEAPPRAKAIGATAMQIFSKQANRWAERECEGEECSAFADALAATEVRVTCAHDSYLINLASPDAAHRARSLDSFAAELRRCEALRLDYLVSHPGNFMDDRASGLARNAESIAAGLERVPGRTGLLMETTAGSGTALGSTFEEMAALIAAVPEQLRWRVGVCVDTAHVFAAGYDLASSYDDVWDRFGDAIGFDRLRVLHLNDAAAPLASNRDRHANVGEGLIGAKMSVFLAHDAFQGLPALLEVPGPDGHGPDAAELEKLRDLRRKGRRAAAARAARERNRSRRGSGHHS